MTAFTPIPGAWFDPLELICSLRSRLGQFGEAKRGQRYLHLRGPAGANDEDIRFSKAWERWPEVQNMVGQIARFGGERFLPPEEGGRIYLSMLDAATPPGPWRRDGGDYIEFYMNLATNPDARLIDAWGNWINPAPGQLVAINRTRPHCAVNMGPCPRIALVIEAKPAQAYSNPTA